MTAKPFDPRTPGDEMLTRRRAWLQEPGQFEVVSRDASSRYEVRISPEGEVSCTCTAGRFGNPCWHTQLALKRAIRQPWTVNPEVGDGAPEEAAG